LTQEDINQAWGKGLKRPLRTAEQEISRLAEKKNQGVVSTPLVVVTGGTALNPAVKSFMSAQCNTENIPVAFIAELGFSFTNTLVEPFFILTYSLRGIRSNFSQPGDGCNGRSLRRERNPEARTASLG
jgi:hypothetical protein